VISWPLAVTARTLTADVPKSTPITTSAASALGTIDHVGSGIFSIGPRITVYEKIPATKMTPAVIKAE